MCLQRLLETILFGSEVNIPDFTTHYVTYLFHVT